MRSSRWTPIAGWCAATATSIVLASVAMLPVLRTDAPDDRALAQLPASDASEFPVPLPSATTPPPKSAVPSATAPTRKPKPTETQTTTTAPPRATTTAPPPVTTTPPTTTEDGWTVTTAGDGTRTYVRSFRVEGGQAVIRMTSDAVVQLVTATPADGWQVQKVQDTPDNLAVYFNETGHSFIIHATWHNDRPFAQVSEIGS
ncbi:DNA mismatch repair protein MutL [Actinoplanes sp. LDG1-06]|uniref:DNA mismatch repair protein MutL n=1 Tax=Paractinoplanes ovalisporus TaxID=2810368 RepID=A0ABS2AB98_9ACTN|nr:DNA mismatch repair protein MutL [Actinoplanes ovalisporus]MBM2617083.1 DNA mismatch repair protein MutL [Actinoplanes ovalisporus]